METKEPAPIAVTSPLAVTLATPPEPDVVLDTVAESPEALAERLVALLLQD